MLHPSPTPSDLLHRDLRAVVIHCSATPDGRDVTAAEIDGWHLARDFHRADAWRARQNPRLAAFGYHFLIRASGCIESGRHLDEPGAHARNHNAYTVGVCLAGTARYSAAQWSELAALVGLLRRLRPSIEVVGHRDLPGVKKACPGFSVAAWLEAGLQPDPAHVLEAA